MLIRRASLADLSGLVKVHVDAWKSTYRGIVPDDYLDRLNYEQGAKGWERMLSQDSDSHVYLAAGTSGTVVGFASGGPNHGKEEGYDAELYAIYILEEHHRQGIGKALLSRLAENLCGGGFHALLTWVLADNTPSRRFYESMGGIPVGQKDITIGGKSLVEVSYGWPDIEALTVNRSAIM